jgi:hypothetical protein
VERPLAIFFDLAIEQYTEERSAVMLHELDNNIINFKKKIPIDFDFIKLSDNSDLFNVIGYKGINIEPLPIPQKLFERIVERGSKFYKHFGWDNSKIEYRSRIIASSESIVGQFLKKQYPNGIMVYTPTMLERAAVYSGLDYLTNPLPVVFPRQN